MGHTPRPYQFEAFKSTAEHLDRDERCLVHMATGTGKTQVACMVAAEYLARKQKVLFIAAADTLIWQAAEAIERETRCKPDIEMGQNRAPTAMFRSDCVVATIQTMSGRRKMQYAQDWFDLIIIDEAHHAAAPTYRTLLGYFDCPRVVGLTATPRRGDKVGLRPIFPHLSFSLPLGKAVREGWLIEPKGMSVPLRGLDISKMRIRAGDFSQDDITAAIDSGGDALTEMVLRTIEHAGDRRTLIFTASVKHAYEAAEIINSRLGRKAAFGIDQKVKGDDRRRMLSSFSHGEYQFMCNVNLATEGFDDGADDGAGIQCISIMRPTLSPGRYEQMIGRGTRTVPGTIDGLEQAPAQDRLDAIAASSKTDLLVLDMTPMAGKHRLVTTGDILDGKPLPDEIRDEIEKSGKIVTLDEIKKAKARAAERAAYAREQERQRAIRLADLFRDAGLKPSEVVSVQLMAEDVLRQKAERRRRWFANRGGASPAQQELLVRRGVVSRAEARDLSKYRASELIEKSNGATDKQIWKLRSLGVDTTGMTLDRKQASRLIDAAIKRGAGRHV